MKRATSPTPSSPSTSSQDCCHGKPTRKSAASYRLFPVVEPPPPASPTTPKGSASLNKAAGGRSSSLGNRTPPKGTSSGSIGTPGATAHTKQSVTSIWNSRKASLPELHPLRAVKEPRNNSTEFCPSPRFIENNGARRQDHNHNASRAQDIPGESVSGQKRADATCASTQMLTNDVAVIRPKRVDSLSPSSSMPQARNQRSKPNLRIAVGLEEQGSRPPTPPTKSPRHLCGESEQAGAFSATFNVQSSTEPPRTPDQAKSSVAYQQSIMPGGAEVRVGELVVTSSTTRGSSTPSPSLPKMHIIPKEYVYETSRSPTRPLSRPSTAAPALTLSSAGEASDNAPLRTLGTHREQPDVSRPRKSRSGLQPPYNPPNLLLRTCKSTGTLNNTDQRMSLRSVETSCAYSSQAAPQKDLVTKVPTPSSPAPSAADDTESIASAIRKHTVGRTGPSDSHISGVETKAAGLGASESFARLALARANVAALRNADPSSGGVEEPRSSGSEHGAFDRAFTAEALSRGLVGPESQDPVRALKDLASQVEALHARYTNLKAERQKISAGLVERLKVQQPGSEFANVLINDQLSLAAVSSSMDICFAKLKYLECRKEDAISALIAQATNTSRSPSDNIASMVASMSAVSRKPSLTPSADTESQYAATGRSTPDLGESFSTKRSTQSSLPRTLSYTSEPGSQSYRLSEISRNSSLRLDTSMVRLSDAAQKEAPATIKEVTESPYRMTTRRGCSPAKRHGASPHRNVASNRKEKDTEESILLRELVDVSSSDDGSLEELLEPMPRTRANGPKAAKVLGVPDEVVAGMSDTAPKPPLEQVSPSALRGQEAHADQDPHSPLPESAGIIASPLTTFSKATDASSEHVESPAIHNLEAELEHFPKPSKPTLAATRSLPALPTVLHGPLSMHPPTPAGPPPDWNEEKRFRHDSATLSREPSCKDSIPKRTMTMGSTRTTHTINVYLEQPVHEDFMEFC